MTARQLDLFNQTNLATVMRDITISMNQAIKDSGKSREQVLDMMNAMAARYGMRLNGRAGLSKDMFEKWLNAEDESRLPSMKGFLVFCAVLRTVNPLGPGVQFLGGQIIEGDDVTLLEIAKLDQQAEKIRRRKKKLKEEL